MLKEPSAATWLWRETNSVTVVIKRISHAARIHVVKVVIKAAPMVQAAIVCQAKSAGW